MKFKIAYFGTPDFSAHLLEKILTDKDLPVEVTLIVTQPDKPVGRNQILSPSPVKIIAQKYKIPVYDEPRQNLLQKVDLALLFAYGEIIPKELLEAPKHGFWNIHPSLLPKYRGPSPIAQLLINGETKTGITLIQMDEELDNGPIIAQEELIIKPAERRPELTNRLTDLGFEIFKKYIIKYRQNNVLSLQNQNHSQATYTHIFKRGDGFIPLDDLKKALTDLKSAKTVLNRYRGLYSWPGIWTVLEPPRLRSEAGKPRRLMRLKIIDMVLVDNHLIINKVQLEGKKSVDFKTFNSAYHLL
jgi:methionyl-tRNA formyltransferase